DITHVSLQSSKEGQFRIDLNELDDILRRVDVFILNSPNNPTGWTATHEELKEIVAMCRRHDVWLISDEVYNRLYYRESSPAPSVHSMRTPDDKIIICNSFSKTWCM